MNTEGTDTICEIKNALAARRLDDVEFERLGDEIELDVQVSIDAEAAAAEAGFVREDDVRDDIAYERQPELFDLRDGLAALAIGDRSMASILLLRAFDGWPDAARVAEDVIRGRSRPDTRQPSLRAA